MKFLLTGLIVCIVVCGCIGQTVGQPGAVNQGASDVSVTINLPDSIKTGELLVGDYALNCTKPIFNISNPDAFGRIPNLYVIRTCDMGQEGSCTSGEMSLSRMFCGTSFPLYACEINDSGYTRNFCSFYVFRRPGTYTYKISVFDCGDIEKNLGVNCSSADQSAVLQNVAPVATGKKTFTVTGSRTGDQCRYGSDCPVCENCKTGRETCSMYGSVCIQCGEGSFFEFQFSEGGCKEGYECRNYRCVKD